MLWSTWLEGWRARPCSNRLYQETPTCASCATSSRRNPGVRRLPPRTNPTCSGERRIRRVRRKSARSCLRCSSLIVLFAPYPTSLNHTIKELWFYDNPCGILLNISHIVIVVVSMKEREPVLWNHIPPKNRVICQPLSLERSPWPKT